MNDKETKKRKDMERRRNEMKTPKYIDTNYDCEGYGTTTGIHKNLGIRRYYRPLIDDPVTPEEAVLARNEQERWRVVAEREEACSHQYRMISHEEKQCIHCGHIVFVPDL